MYGLQCTACGHSVGGWIRKEDWPRKAPAWDDDLSTKWWEERRRHNEAERAESREAWLADHDAYMQTPEWAELRARVCEREGGICQGCRSRRGTQAHHITYDRWRHELLTDLVWFCKSCHERAHT